MKRYLVAIALFTMMLGLASITSAQSSMPTVSQARRNARKELGQLGIEYSKEAFTKQAAEGDTIAVQLFIAAGMDPDAYNKEGQTPLTTAAGNEHAETVQALLAGKADINKKVSGGNTALMSAATGPYRHAPSVVKLLLDNGADVNAANTSGRTALHNASSRADIVKALLDKGAEVNAKGKEGEAALMWAASSGRSDSVKVLLLCGAEP